MLSFLFIAANIPLIIGVCGAAVIAIVVVAIVIGILKGKKGKIKVDEEFMEQLFQALGGKDNIKGYSVENARVKFELLDLKVADLDSLKTLSPKGVFVTNNHVKTLFKYESQIIVKMLDKMLK